MRRLRGRGNFGGLAPGHLLKGNMDNTDTDEALERLRSARDLIISTHLKLKDNGASG